MNHSFKIKSFNPANKQLTIELDEELNIERLKTLYNDDLSSVTGELVLPDPRRFTSKQRALYRALLNDIYIATGQGTDLLHDFFKEYYKAEYNKSISTRNDSKTTVSEMNDLINLVLEFMFEYNISFTKGYELLTKTESYFLYACCKYRKCVVCGKRADIHHVDAVGMGNNRQKVDNSWREFMAVCRTHHVEVETIGNQAFFSKYKVKGIKLDDKLIKKLRI